MSGLHKEPRVVCVDRRGQAARASGLLVASVFPFATTAGLAQSSSEPTGADEPIVASVETEVPPGSGGIPGEGLDGESENVFASLDLEDLMKVQVSSVTGTKASWFQMPAAVTVLTAEDIRRAGHRSIPEALRLVPGMHVTRLDSGNWAISTRGFTTLFANKLQVLMDGRRLYDPLFSGVFWDVQDTVMEDLEQIEVIRGPGATLWGANAVNGVINITTKSAADTQGLLIAGGGGNVERGFGAVRYGGQIDEQSHFRVYAKYRNFNDTDSVNAGRRPDDWDTWQTGFRFDFGDPDETQLTLQGDIFEMPERGTRTTVPAPTGHFATITSTGEDSASGANLLARMRHQVSDSSHWTAQAYYDNLHRESLNGFEYTRDSIDLDFRYNLELGDRHEVVWGVGFRHDSLDTVASSMLVLTPASRGLNTVSAFAQDTVTLVPDRVFAMAGAKIEYNDFSGFEIQPSARVWWTPDDKQTIWGAFSRPVRTPSWIEQNMALLFATADPGLLAPPLVPTGMTIPLYLTGNSGFEAERVQTWEAGYRRRLSETLTVDVAGFYSNYQNLSRIDTASLTLVNGAEAETYGVEVSTTWKVAPNWTLQGKYSLLEFHGEPAEEGTSPRHQFQIDSRLDVTDDLEFNGALYFVDKLPANGTDAYTRLDLGLTWRPRPNFEISIWGQNLLEPGHVEFFESYLPLDSPAVIERSVTVQATIRF